MSVAVAVGVSSGPCRRQLYYAVYVSSVGLEEAQVQVGLAAAAAAAAAAD